MRAAAAAAEAASAMHSCSGVVHRERAAAAVAAPALEASCQLSAVLVAPEG